MIFLKEVDNREIKDIVLDYRFRPNKILDFSKALEPWRSVRKLTPESQISGYFNNTLEEINELQKAVSTKDIHEYIDAICDVLVLTFNTFSRPHSFEKYIEVVKDEGYLETLQNTLVVNGESEINMFISLRNSFNHTLLQKDGDPIIKAVKMYVLAEIILRSQRYSLTLALEEVVKQISSRTGAWSDTAQKWIKDTSPEAKAKEYQADFTNAKVR